MRGKAGLNRARKEERRISDSYELHFWRLLLKDLLALTPNIWDVPTLLLWFKTIYHN